MTTLASDPVLGALARSLGVDVEMLDVGVVGALRGERLLMSGSVEGARAVRDRGFRGAIVLRLEVGVPEPTADQRRGLEPIAWLREAAAEGLCQALAAVDTPSGSGRIHMAGGVVDLDARTFERGEVRVSLTGQEVGLLAYLNTRSGRAVDPAELLTQVWGYRRAVDTKAVSMAVSRVRKKIERDPSHPTCLLTVRGAGYRLVPDGVVRPVPGRERGPLIGRTSELARLEDALRTAGSVVVLSGPPGVGKSRLAREFARRQAPGRYRGGVVVARVGESPVVDVCRALGWPVPANGWLGLVEALRACAPMLLVLDGAPLAGRSNRVDVPDAWEHNVLLVDERGGDIELGRLSTEEGAAMYRSLAGPLGPQDDAAVEALVERLEGLPLALAWAARRVDVLGPADVSVDRLPGVGAVLNATLERLPTAVASGFVQVCAFEGAFDREDAEALVDRAVFDGLVQRGWVRRDERFRVPGVFLGIGRCHERFARARERHQAWLVERATAWAGVERTLQESAQLDWGLAHLDDVMAACRRALQAGDPAAEVLLPWCVRVLRTRGPVELAGPLLDAWCASGSARAFLDLGDLCIASDRERALEAYARASMDERWRARGVRGGLQVRHWLHGPREALDWLAGRSIEEALSRFLVLDLRERCGEVTVDVALDEGRALFERAEALDRIDIGLMLISKLAWNGRFDEAARVLSDLWGDVACVPDPVHRGRVSLERANLAYLALDYSGCLVHLREAEAVFSARAPGHVMGCLRWRGPALLGLERHRSARGAMERLLVWAMAHGAPIDAAVSRLARGRLHLDRGAWELALADAAVVRDCRVPSLVAQAVVVEATARAHTEGCAAARAVFQALDLASLPPNRRFDAMLRWSAVGGPQPDVRAGDVLTEPALAALKAGSGSTEGRIVGRLRELSASRG